MSKAFKFRTGSHVDILNKHFKQGKSLTHDEAVALGVGRPTQRMQDLKSTYEEKAGFNPIMVYYEPNSRGGTRARYFYKGAGSPLETKSEASTY